MKRKIIKQLKNDLNDYYNIDNKLDDIKANMTFTEKESKDNNVFIFSKKSFILSTALASIVLIGLGVLSGSLINPKQDLNFIDSYRTYNTALKEANEYFATTSYESIETFYTTKIDKSSYLNIYQGQKNNESIYFYQLFTSNNDTIKCELSIKDTDKQKTITNDMPIDILNTSNFDIQINDIVYGNIYLGENEVLFKSIVINF